MKEKDIFLTLNLGYKIIIQNTSIEFKMMQ